MALQRRLNRKCQKYAPEILGRDDKNIFELH